MILLCVGAYHPPETAGESDSWDKVAASWPLLSSSPTVSCVATLFVGWNLSIEPVHRLDSPSSIQDFHQTLLSINVHQFPVSVFDSGIIGANEDVPNELHCQSRLSNTSTLKVEKSWGIRSWGGWLNEIVRGSHIRSCGWSGQGLELKVKVERWREERGWFSGYNGVWLNCKREGEEDWGMREQGRGRGSVHMQNRTQRNGWC